MSQLKVININLANLHLLSHPNKIKHFAEFIYQHQPDIIAVQEIGGYFHKDQHPVISDIAKYLLIYLKQRFSLNYRYQDIAPFKGQSGGDSSLNIRCGFFYRSEIMCNALTAIGKDLPEFKGDDKIYQPSRMPIYAIFQVKNHTIHMINCHLKSMNGTKAQKKLYRKQRHKQIESILDYIQQHQLAKHNLLLVGDFNDSPDSKTIEYLKNSSLFAPELESTERIYSYIYQGKKILLDYVYFSPKLTLKSYKICHLNTDKTNVYFSDHDPVITEFFI